MRGGMKSAPNAGATMKQAPIRMKGQKIWLSHPSICACVMVIIFGVGALCSRTGCAGAGSGLIEERPVGGRCEPSLGALQNTSLYFEAPDRPLFDQSTAFGACGVHEQSSRFSLVS